MDPFIGEIRLVGFNFAPVGANYVIALQGIFPSRS